MDQGIGYQQNLEGRELAIVTVVAATNEYEMLLPLVPAIVNAARKVMEGAVISVAA